MGTRFRKSKNFGPLRFTLSKSGLGMSVGVKGFRVTKTANGRLRTTASIPGTGISYVKDRSVSSQNKRKVETPAMKSANINGSPRAPKMTGFYVLVVLGAISLLTGISEFLYGPTITDYENSWVPMLAGAVLLIASIFVFRVYKKEAAAYEAAVQGRQDLIQQIKDNAKREYEESQAKQAAWNAAHGRIVTNIAGVTFQNEDGSSRQAALKDAYVNGNVGTVELEAFEYKGEEAIRVLYEGACIGNIPRARVAEVLPIMDKITAGYIDAEPFERDEDRYGNEIQPERIYRADLTLIYDKPAPD